MNTGIHIGLGGVSGGGGGFIFITNVTPTADGNVAPNTHLSGTVPENKVLLSCSSDTPLITVSFEAEGGGGEDFTPLVKIGDTYCDNLQAINDRYFSGSIDIDITDVGTGDVRIISSAGQNASVYVTLGAPPVVLSVTQFGDLPGTQTELKEDDVVSIKVTADMDFTSIEVAGFGAGKQQVPYAVTPATIANIPIYIAAHASLTQSPVKARVITEDGSTSEWFTSNDLFPCNNQHPVIVLDDIEYPGSQLALKGSEEATVKATITEYDSDVRTVLDVDSVTELAIVSQDGGDTVVKRVDGGYNISSANFKISATRTANDAPTDKIIKVFIANDDTALNGSHGTVQVRSNDVNAPVSILTNFTQKTKIIQATAEEGSVIGGTTVGYVTTHSPGIYATTADPHSATELTLTLDVENYAGKETQLIRKYLIKGFAKQIFELDYPDSIVEIGCNIVDLGGLTMSGQINADTVFDSEDFFTVLIPYANTFTVNNIKEYKINPVQTEISFNHTAYAVFNYGVEQAGDGLPATLTVEVEET